jgi:glycerol-3-phosphate acyltransferase PlsY
VGGKGVATALGVLLAINWILGVATLVTWVLIAAFFRYSSLASLLAALFAPLYYILGDGVVWAMDKSVVLTTAVMSLFLIWRHAENIGRLVKGNESKLGKKKA